MIFLKNIFNLKLFYYKKFLSFCFYFKFNFFDIFQKRPIKICFLINLRPFASIKNFLIIYLYAHVALNRLVDFSILINFYAVFYLKFTKNRRNLGFFVVFMVKKVSKKGVFWLKMVIFDII